jgi:hypothetical protein
MSKILILPDVHNRWEKAEKVIKFVKPDQTILIGDYFDDFNDDPQIITEVAEWFRHSVNQKNRIHICGNHDLHYWFKDNKFLRCSGYQQFKSIAINDFVTRQDWEKLIFYYILDDQWLLSHAGVHPSWIDRMNFQAATISELSLNMVNSRLKRASPEAVKSFYRNKMHWFGIPGFSRDRSSPYYGGITWLDWNKEFHPIRGIHQLVGHTPSYTPTWKIVEDGGTSIKDAPIEGVVNPVLTDKSSYNVCIDSQPGSQFYAIYENKQLIIKKATEV